MFFFLKVLAYTVLQPVKQICIATGECLNLIFTTVGSDLGFINRTVVQLIVIVSLLSLIVIFLFFVFCNECKIFYGLFSFKRNAPPEMSVEEKIRIEKQILYETAVRLRNNQVNVPAIEYNTVQSLVDNIGTAIVQVADEKKKEVLTEISTKFAIKFKRHDQIGDSIQNENHTVETLFSNIDSSVTQIRESIIKNASKAVLAIEKNREETIEKTKILESTDDLSVYENSSSNIRRRMKRSSSSDSFNVINDGDLNESFSDQRFD
jgi:hypothetical protein